MLLQNLILSFKLIKEKTYEKKHRFFVCLFFLVLSVCFSFAGCKKTTKANYISDSDFLMFGEWEFRILDIFDYTFGGRVYTCVDLIGNGFYNKELYEVFGNRFTVKTAFKIYHPTYVNYARSFEEYNFDPENFVTGDGTKCEIHGNLGTVQQKYGDTPVYIFKDFYVLILIDNEVKEDTFARVYFEGKQVCEFN